MDTDINIVNVTLGYVYSMLVIWTKIPILYMLPLAMFTVGWLCGLR